VEAPGFHDVESTDSPRNRELPIIEFHQTQLGSYPQHTVARARQRTYAVNGKTLRDGPLGKVSASVLAKSGRGSQPDIAVRVRQNIVDGLARKAVGSWQRLKGVMDAPAHAIPRSNPHRALGIVADAVHESARNLGSLKHFELHAVIRMNRRNGRSAPEHSIRSSMNAHQVETSQPFGEMESSPGAFLGIGKNELDRFIRPPRLDRDGQRGVRSLMADRIDKTIESVTA